MVKPVTIRKLVAGLGTAVIIAISFFTKNTLPLKGLLTNIIGATGAITIFTSITLALAIHRSYPEKHDQPKDFSELFTKGPYELCRHPFYFFIMLAQISIPFIIFSLWGVLTALALTPLWLYLVKLEEQELVIYWGEKYLEYMKKTPILIPDLRRLRRAFK